MSLSEIGWRKLVRIQAWYKLRTHSGLYGSLAISQIAALLLSFSGIGMHGFGDNQMMLSIRQVSGDILLGFAFVWMLTISVSMASKGVRDSDFAFPSTRMSSHLSSILFLLTAAGIGAIAAVLGGLLLRILLLLFHHEAVLFDTWQIAPAELFIGWISAMGYMILIGSVGYLAGSLTQLLFGVLLPIFFLGVIFTETRRHGQGALLVEGVTFFTQEGSLFLFILKVLTAAFVLFAISVLLTNRKEVRL